MTRMLEMFSCEPLDCRLTRKACAERHRLANRKPGPGREAMEAARLRQSECAACEVGKAHAAESEDVPEAVRTPRPGKESTMAKQAARGERRAAILEFIEANPNSTTKAVGDALGITENNARTALYALRKQGRVEREKTDDGIVWRLGAGAPPASPAPRKRRSKSKPKRTPKSKPVEVDDPSTEHPAPVELLVFGGFECDYMRAGNRLIISIELDD